ncbi:MAG: hypothetical protein FJ146_00105 [Deltaproteobacteria bacterium]|nr:hypothetical protein [Deltaproteobacteria bacterium]
MTFLLKSLIAVPALTLSIATVASANEGAAALEHGENALTGFVCVARNLRGAEYYGYSYGEGPWARDQACNEALGKCFRDSILVRSCHIVNAWPG